MSPYLSRTWGRNLKWHLKLFWGGRCTSNAAYLCFHKFIPVVVWEGAAEKRTNVLNITSKTGIASLLIPIRRVQNQSVPLALDVILFGLLGDVQSIEFQLSGKFLLPFEDHQWNLKWQRVMIETCITFTRWKLWFRLLYLQAVIANNADKWNDRVQGGEEGQCGLHVSRALL